MAGFLKVLLNNLLQGPSTDPYPLGETFTPERVRARCVVDPEICVGCGMCRYSCAAGAINITKKPDNSGFTITIWRDSCCLCAACRHYCPTGAMSLNNDWHFAHPEAEKYTFLEQHTIDFVPCIECGNLMRPLPLKMAERIYAHDPNVEPDHIRRLCPQCRRLEDARRNERVYPEAVTPAETGDLPAVEARASGAQISMDANDRERATPQTAEMERKENA